MVSGTITVGDTLTVEGKGFGFDPNLVFIRFRDQSDPNDEWDFKVKPTAGRLIEATTPVPSLGVGQTVDVLVGEGTPQYTSSAEVEDDHTTGKMMTPTHLLVSTGVSATISS